MSLSSTDLFQIRAILEILRRL